MFVKIESQFVNTNHIVRIEEKHPATGPEKYYNVFMVDGEAIAVTELPTALKSALGID